VEYRLSGINQVQVNTSINLDFVNVLRAFLRQDPNVILIGEVRDIESARIASQAALTGHLVFATMHTNNALQAVNRMIDIGVEPFLVAPSLIALMAQRLVRRICPNCIEKYPAPKSVLDDNFEWDGVAAVYFSRGKGCPQCRGTGYLGRLALHELFILNSATREKIAQNASILIVEEIALKSGFKPLRYDGLKKVLRGLTTIEEVDRVTYHDVE
jgi:type IV pilus assembly protein PilB